MTETQLCTRCGEREVWAAVFPVPRLRDNGGRLSVSTHSERLCRECYHAEQRALAAEERRQLRDRLAAFSSDELRQFADHLALAAKEASAEEWRALVTGLRDAETLRGRPWPSEIQRFLRHEAGDDPEASA